LTADSELSAGESVTLSTEKLAEVPWDFASGESHNILTSFQDGKNPLLTDIFGGIFQGVRTGANDVFVLSAKAAEALEPDLILPFVTGRQIKDFAINGDELRLIYPYSVDEFGVASLVSEAVLRAKYPKVWSHLSSHKGELSERSHDAGSAWYGFSRSQNLAGHKLKKILVKEMMPRAEFAADFEGTLAFGAGYALDASRLPRSEIMLWAAVLNTPTMEFALRHAGTQLHSGWFRMLKHHLRRVRLPNLSRDDRQEALRLAAKLHNTDVEQTRRECLRSLDELVSRSFGLSSGQNKFVRAFLADCHRRSIKSTEDSVQATPPASAQDEKATQFEPVKLSRFNRLHRERSDLRRDVTFKDNKKLPIHRWYPYTQGFSGALVETLLQELGVSTSEVVLDPFAGSGTTSLVCSRRGVASTSVDISPLMTWVTSVKVAKYRIADIDKAVSSFDYSAATKTEHALPDASEMLFRDYFAQAYSGRILAQLISISEYIRRIQASQKVRAFLMLGLVGLLEEVSNIRKHGSHYRFLNKPESVGLRKLNIPVISDRADLGPILRKRHEDMLADIARSPIGRAFAEATVLTGDVRSLDLPAGSVDVVITSPPYLNRNNYIAQQKAELSLLGLVTTYSDYKCLVRSTFRSHVESSLDKEAVSQFSEVSAILDRIALTPGNNPKIPHMIAGYFSDLARTTEELFRIMKSGGRAAFVVGNTRWGGVVIPIDHLLMMLAERAGFHPERILVTRLKGNSPQQMRAYGRIPVRESIVIFRKR
jgi:hypothetical protein